MESFYLELIPCTYDSKLLKLLSISTLIPIEVNQNYDRDFKPIVELNVHARVCRNGKEMEQSSC